MNKPPIETARDNDLRMSRRAMQRAAERARELARQTGTRLVVVRQGVVEHIPPEVLAKDHGGSRARGGLQSQEMTGFSPKTYQTQALDSIEAYFKACHERPVCLHSGEHGGA
jgi:hypothetical protein